MDRKILAAIIVLASIAAVEGVYIALTMQGLTGKFPGSIDMIYEEYTEQLNANIELIEDLNELKMEHTALTNEYDRLQQTYEDFMVGKNETDENYAEIFNDFKALERDYEETLGQLLELQGNYDYLWEDHMVSQSVFESLDAEMLSLLEEYQEYQDDYRVIMEEINTRGGVGDLKGRLMTPDNEEVMNATFLITITTGDEKTDMQRWNDIRDLFDWVDANIAYSFDSYQPLLPRDVSESIQWIRDTYRYPNETLHERRGDDEDQALLLASMIEAYDDSTSCWVILAESKTSTRSAAMIINDGRISILDPESGYYTGKEIGSLLEHPPEYAVQNWFNDWDEANMGITSTFDMDVCVEFDSIQEFYNWVNALQ